MDDWTKKLPQIIEGYEPRDIFNMDETGVFYRAFQDKILRLKGEDCRGGKKSKERLTVVLCINMVGEFQKSLVIGNVEKPRYFRNLNPSNLPVTLTSNKRSWMTSPFKRMAAIF